MTYLDTAALLAALTQLQERDYPEQGKDALEAAQAALRARLTEAGVDTQPIYARLREIDVALSDLALLGGQVRIRELTAAQRQQANDAAVPMDADGLPLPADHALYRALVVQMGVREPSLTAADVAALRNGRSATVQRLAVAILQLSEATPEAVRLKSDTDDAPESGTGDSAGDAG